MGAAWREVSQVGPRQFKRVCDMIKEVNDLGLEVCVTLGMLNKEQAKQLKEAGLTAYNHNLDTSEEHYSKVVTTRTYEDRLETLQNVRDAGLSTCCGGILGLGESHEDRVSLLHTLSTMEKHPESVPVNALVPNEGLFLVEVHHINIQKILWVYLGRAVGSLPWSHCIWGCCCDGAGWWFPPPFELEGSWE